MKNYIRSILALGFVTFLTADLSAQTTATQKFTVSVPTSISITAPANVAITHNETDSNQAFPGSAMGRQRQHAQRRNRVVLDRQRLCAYHR